MDSKSHLGVVSRILLCMAACGSQPQHGVVDDLGYYHISWCVVVAFHFDVRYCCIFRSVVALCLHR